MEEGRQWKCSGGGGGKTIEIQWLWRWEDNRNIVVVEEGKTVEM